MSYTVYTLHSPKCDKIYVGHISNLEAGMTSHNEKGMMGWTEAIANTIKLKPMTIDYGTAVLLFVCLITMMWFPETEH